MKSLKLKPKMKVRIFIIKFDELGNSAEISGLSLLSTSRYFVVKENLDVTTHIADVLSIFLRTYDQE